MPSHKVFFSRRAQEQLEELEYYIANAASPRIAAQYIDDIVKFCYSLSTFPHRGAMRDDIRQGIRLTNYKKRTVIAFSVEEFSVHILGIFYGGQDYKSWLTEYK